MPPLSLEQAPSLAVGIVANKAAIEAHKALFR